MSIRPIDFNGMIQNTTEVSASKSSEQQKPVVQQEFASNAVKEGVDLNMHSVKNKEEAANHPFDFEGGGQGDTYQANRNKKKKKEKEKVSDGSVRLKNDHGSFDMKI